MGNKSLESELIKLIAAAKIPQTTLKLSLENLYTEVGECDLFKDFKDYKTEALSVIDSLKQETNQLHLSISHLINLYFYILVNHLDENAEDLLKQRLESGQSELCAQEAILSESERSHQIIAAKQYIIDEFKKYKSSLAA